MYILNLLKLKKISYGFAAFLAFAYFVSSTNFAYALYDDSDPISANRIQKVRLYFNGIESKYNSPPSSERIRS
ncbi:MAG: hypothetical protein Fur0022_40700 [Anaerolineales bacterium]